MKRVAVVFGTRPEAIKMCPLVNELKARDGFSVTVIVSGQHREMLDGVLREFSVTPDFDMNIMRAEQTLDGIASEVIFRTGALIKKIKPDLMLVHGDTSTSFAAALSAFHNNIPIAHIEAGLRSKSIKEPFPEEFNRRAIALIAEYHFAPTKLTRQNLLREGIDASKIFVVGNTAVDALKYTVKKDFSHSALDFAADRDLILVTAHRRESLGEPMERILLAVRRISEEYERVRIIFPMHKNPKVRECAERILGGREGIMLTEPLGVIDCHNIIARSKIILTDSGGIQEEAVSLGVPTLVLRSRTERCESETLGILRVVGSDGEVIFREFSRLYENPEEYKKAARPLSVYGDGSACRKIVDRLEAILL